MLLPLGRLERPPVTREEPNMGTKRLLCTILSSLVLAACTAWQQGLTPGVIGASPTPDPMEAQTVATTGHPGGRLIVRGARPDTKWLLLRRNRR